MIRSRKMLMFIQKFQFLKLNNTSMNGGLFESIAHQPTNNNMVQHQEKPCQSFLKCNIDVTIFNDHQCFGVGLCIRNHVGEFIKAKSLVFQGNSKPREAKVLCNGHKKFKVRISFSSLTPSLCNFQVEENFMPLSQIAKPSLEIVQTLG